MQNNQEILSFISHVFFSNLAKLHAMHHNWRYIYMVTRSHTQLKQDDITEDLSICDSSEPNLKNFCCKRRRKPQRTMLRGDTHMMSTFGGEGAGGG